MLPLPGGLSNVQGLLPPGRGTGTRSLTGAAQTVQPSLSGFQARYRPETVGGTSYQRGASNAWGGGAGLGLISRGPAFAAPAAAGGAGPTNGLISGQWGLGRAAALKRYLGLA